MIHAHQIAKSFSDAGLSTLIEMLEYKVSETGTKLVKVDRAFTTQTCSECGHVRKGEGRLGLQDLIFFCSCCGLNIDRDLNAAKNILSRTGQVRSHACGDDVRLAEAVVVEAGTIRFEIEAGNS